MAVRKTKNEKEYYIQFSKRMVAFVVIFWAVVRLTAVIANIINPSSGESMALILKGVDDIAMVNVLAYTSNSISEKISLGYFKYKTAEIKNAVKPTEKSSSVSDDEADIDNG